MSMDSLIDHYGLLQNKRWIITVSVIFVTTLLVQFIEHKTYNRLIERARKTKYIWDDALLSATHGPLGMLIWLQAFHLSIKLVQSKFPVLNSFDWVSTFCTIGTILIFTWFFLRLVNSLKWNMLFKTEFQNAFLDLTTCQALAQVTQIGILLISGLIIVKYFFNVSLTGLWAIGGVGSFMIGWAAKDLLANFFGTVMIYLDRPFSIGDWVRSPDRNIEGTVEYIGWRLTQIRTFDKRSLYIPNSLFATICIENVSRTTYQRIKETFSVSFKEINELESILNHIKKMLNGHADLIQTMMCTVNLTGVNKSSLNISVVCFTKMTDWASFLEIKQNVILQVLKIIQEHGAELAFPTSVLKMPPDNDLSHSRHSLPFS